MHCSSFAEGTSDGALRTNYLAAVQTDVGICAVGGNEMDFPPCVTQEIVESASPKLRISQRILLFPAKKTEIRPRSPSLSP
jgi:hypothetical protein